MYSYSLFEQNGRKFKVRGAGWSDTEAEKKTHNNRRGNSYIHARTRRRDEPQPQLSLSGTRANTKGAADSVHVDVDVAIRRWTNSTAHTHTMP